MLSGLLGFDTALYYIDWSDIQIPLNYTSDGLWLYTANAARASSKGLEISAELRLSADLTISGWYAYNDAVLSSNFASASVAGRKGDRLPFAGKSSGHLSLEWKRAIGGKWGLELGGEASFIDERYGLFTFPSPTTPRGILPAYTQLDARAGLRSNDWLLGVYVNNLTNKQGILRGPSDFVPNLYTTTQPRTIGVNLAHSF